MNETPLWLLFSLLASLLLLSAFFSSSETGMMAINRYRLKHLEKTHRSARLVSKLLARPDRLIGIILIGNNLVNILATTVTTLIAIRLYGSDSLAVTVVAPLLLTLVVLIFSEVTPKTLAALHPERIAFPASYILRPLLSILYPVVALINAISNGLLKLIGVDMASARGHELSRDELRTVVDESTNGIPKDHQGMLLNILELEDVTVDDIMIPRNEIIGLDLEQDIDTLADTMVNSEYTRLPVYEGDINNIVGILHMRKVSRLLRGHAGELNQEAIRRFARDPYFIPENTPLHIQLVNFKNQKRRCALVVDEYGEVQGLVTLEDILEEIVGDFTTNQADVIDQDVQYEGKGVYLIDASATIRDINKATDWELPTDGPKTLNGLAMEVLENIPDGNVSFTIDNYRFETVQLDDKRVIMVRGKKVDMDQLKLID